jgi:hypothetical protein
MGMGVSDAAQIRDISHNLDLTDREHVKIYEALAFRFIAVNEVRGIRSNALFIRNLMNRCHLKIKKLKLK